MYAELGENINGTASFDAAAKIETDGNQSKNAKIKIKKDSDLRKSLMNDDENIDVESGQKKRFPAPASRSIMANNDDPYYVFKEDLLIKIELVEDGLQRYERIVKNTVSQFVPSDLKALNYVPW